MSDNYKFAPFLGERKRNEARPEEDCSCDCACDVGTDGADSTNSINGTEHVESLSAKELFAANDKVMVFSSPPGGILDPNGPFSNSVLLSSFIRTSALTTKGDILSDNGTGPNRQPVGADGSILTSSSGTNPNGLAWTSLGAQGSILAAQSTTVIGGFPVGADGSVLSANSANAPYGLQYTAGVAKGSLLAGASNTANAWFPTAANGSVLSTNSAVTDGLQWTTGVAAGSILAGTSATANAWFPVGTANQILSTNPSANGLLWVSPSATLPSLYAEYLQFVQGANASVAVGSPFLVGTLVNNTIPTSVSGTVASNGGTYFQLPAGTFAIDYETSTSASASLALFFATTAPTLIGSYAVDNNTICGSSTGTTWIHGRAIKTFGSTTYFFFGPQASGANVAVPTAGFGAGNYVVRVTIQQF